jgi:uncharacterized protein
MAVRGIYQNAPLIGKVEETHISWVILSKNYAFKIKKPIKLGFLDFSTLDLRRELCEKEVRLNSRFSNIYITVLPICLVGKQWVIGGDDNSVIVDYCVVMRKMSVAKRLDNVLNKQMASEKSIRALATVIAAFHNRAEKVFTPFEIENTRSIFNDIASIIPFVTHNIEAQLGEIIKRSIEWSDACLERYRERIQQRIAHGLKRDVHGDLHCGNIFLYSKPVLFDCIEFNDQFRQIDVLYELAFLCMDLERFQQKRLSEVLLSEYIRHFPAFQQKEDHNLFVYFKSLRANIRAKVHALQWQQAENEIEASLQISEVRKYLRLMNEYIAHMSSMPVF